ncbi:MAG: DNA-processing protein DprA [Pyrinomonadaceae bacterium]
MNKLTPTLHANTAIHTKTIRRCCSILPAYCASSTTATRATRTRSPSFNPPPPRFCTRSASDSTSRRTLPLLSPRGNLDILKQSDMLALFCSRKCLGDLILKLYDYARELRQQGTTVISGFHTPMEQECLTILLRGTGSLMICPARSLENMRLPNLWKKSLDAGRLLLLSPFAEKQRRAIANQARLRNEIVASLATQITIVYADTGGKTEQLAARITEWGKSLFTFDSAANSNLIDLGARRLTVASETSASDERRRDGR